MFNRRMLLALVACLVLSTSAAMAGGNGGTKKNSTLRVVNNSSNPIYAFVDVSDANIQAASTQADPLGAFRALGGKQIAAGNNSVNFSVLAGSHTVTAVDIVAQVAVGQKTVNATRGATSTVTFP